ncbi:hypothetical protein CEXT_671581 [Caerostris extrusa]|uniref:Uncharacterized protein n=1 Tax=Caerostris extrusa TaxID=172846 RepID=A0AAV4T665_CAEEX|nr:hypothetical protein CEXT_671581 [Caerostris extrusa]
MCLQAGGFDFPVDIAFLTGARLPRCLLGARLLVPISWRPRDYGSSCVASDVKMIFMRCPILLVRLSYRGDYFPHLVCLPRYDDASYSRKKSESSLGGRMHYPEKNHNYYLMGVSRNFVF